MFVSLFSSHLLDFITTFSCQSIVTLFYSLNLQQLFYLSEAIDRWIEVDPAGEVCIAPLREGCFLLEVPLDLREVLLLHEVVETAIGRTEVILRVRVVHRRLDACALGRRFCDLGLVLTTVRD